MRSSPFIELAICSSWSYTKYFPLDLSNPCLILFLLFANRYKSQKKVPISFNVKSINHSVI